MAAYWGITLWKMCPGLSVLSSCCIHIRTYNVAHFLRTKKSTTSMGLLTKLDIVSNNQLRRTGHHRGHVGQCGRVLDNKHFAAKISFTAASCQRNYTHFSSSNRASQPSGFCQCRNLSDTCSVLTCWNCNASVAHHLSSGAVYFCAKCNVIQPVAEELTHFQVMQCDERYDLDEGQLTQTFRSLQRQLHPDKYSNRPLKEQGYSADQSSAVNKAYSTLLKPLSRGLYLLQLHGHSIEEDESSVQPEFLMEVMETNERLAETHDMDTVRHIRAKNKELLDNLIKNLSEVFSKNNFVEARNILIHLKYYANIEDKAKDILGTDA